jgi:hypothetical protein
MKHIKIAGEDRTQDILPGTDTHPPATDPAALLLQARNEAEYLSRLLSKLRTESGLHTSTLTPSTRPSPLGRLQGTIRRFLWKLLRYQHDHMAFQQSAINTQTAAALEFLRAEYQHDLNRLSKRLAALEKRDPSPPAP